LSGIASSSKPTFNLQPGTPRTGFIVLLQLQNISWRTTCKPRPFAPPERADCDIPDWDKSPNWSLSPDTARKKNLAPRVHDVESLASMLDQMANEIKLISGSSHPELSALVASRYVSDDWGLWEGLVVGWTARGSNDVVSSMRRTIEDLAEEMKDKC